MFALGLWFHLFIPNIFFLKISLILLTFLNAPNTALSENKVSHVKRPTFHTLGLYVSAFFFEKPYILLFVDQSLNSQSPFASE